MLHFSRILCFTALIVLTTSGLAMAQPAPMQDDTMENEPTIIPKEEMDMAVEDIHQNSFTPLMWAMINVTTSANIMKQHCKIGSGRLSPEFIKNQNIIDRAAINQIKEMGHSEEVAIKYLQKKKQTISDIIHSRTTHDPLFCNGDYALYMGSLYKKFERDPQQVVMDINEDITEDVPTEEEVATERTLELIEQLKQ